MEFNPDIIIVSDYNKGVVTRDLLYYLEELPIKLIIDPKPENQYRYKKCFLITPNEKEYMKMSLWENPGLKNIIVTRGKDGITIIRSEGNYGPIDIPGNEAQVYNVTGCGDVVVSVMAVCISMGMSIEDSATTSNFCAAHTATLPGTSLLSKEKFEQFSGMTME
jgi:bifunctional ADP-heptose synthase (sugar kinase/adenylyltransferase)